MTRYLRSPRQASTTFDLGGAQTPRPKGLFVVRFRRGDNSQGTSYWQRDLGFLVKSIDQPTISPKTEEVNQYNKKRQAITGYTINPVNMTLFDTADGMALQMWSEYAKHHFGDFSQSVENYRYDLLDEESMKGADIGYGFLATNEQFFFTAIDIYQVFRNAYTKTTLVNPKITAFDPEDLDYEQMNTVMYRLTLAYEAVLYHSDGAPQSIDADAELAAAFKDIRLHGDIIEVSGPPAAPLPGGMGPISGNVAQKPLGGLGGILGNMTNAITGIFGSRGASSSGLGGVLGGLGNLDFGSLAGQAVSAVVSGNTRNLGATIGGQALSQITGNSQLATIVGMVATKQPTSAIAGQVLGAVASNGGLNPQTYELASAAINAASGNKAAQGALAGRLVQGVLAGSILNKTSPSAQAQDGPSKGLNLTSAALAVVNSKGSPISFIGRRI